MQYTQTKKTKRILLALFVVATLAAFVFLYRINAHTNLHAYTEKVQANNAGIDQE